MSFKKLEFYKNHVELKPGISVVVFTKNSETDLKELLETIKKEKYDELIISDENSSDDTIKISKCFTKNIIKSKHILGRKRVLEAINFCKYKFFLLIETDQRFKKGLFEKLETELLNSNSYLAYSKLKIIDAKNFFEKGQKVHYEILRYKKYFGTPYISYTKFMQEMYQSEYIPEGSGNDSALLDLFKMNLINVSNITEESIQKEKLNFKIFFEKYRWYGEGDYLFLKNNMKIWNLIRILKSIFYVLINYLFILPIIGLLKFKFIYIPFIILAGIIRYYGFFKKLFKSN